MFHPYALYKMQKRNINRQKVQKTLEKPDSVVSGKWGRKIAQKIYGRYLIRVIFEEQEDKILVITAYPTKPERYLDLEE